MAERKTYSEQQRAEALELYRTDGPTAVQERLGIPKGTIVGWARKAGLRTERQAKTARATEARAADNSLLREDLKLEFRRKARALLDRMDAEYTEFVGKEGDRVHYPMPPAGAVRDYMIAAATAVDKAELLDGRATGRMDFRNMDQIDRELERMLEEAARTNGNGNRARSSA